MENNFFVGNVVHKNKKGNNLYSEKIVLYTCDNVYFIDLLTDNTILLIVKIGIMLFMILWFLLIVRNLGLIMIICLLNIMMVIIIKLKEKDFYLKNKKINY